MKTYCTQNNDDCSTCSLVNYNRDCQNNPLVSTSNSSYIRIRVPEETKTNLQRHCDDKCINMSELLRRLIDNYLRSEAKP